VREASDTTMLRHGRVKAYARAVAPAAPGLGLPLLLRIIIS
jgi:hypothetical protein